MKHIKRIFCAAVVLCLLLGLAPAAFAADSEEMDALYKDKTWDEVVDKLLQTYKVDPDSVGLAYYNTVTGEEHYLNADQYMVSGSMYKVPLNMAFAEKVAAGELSWDTAYGAFTLEEMRDKTIIHSDNDLARTLWTILSNYQSYRAYRVAIAPLMGEDPETVGAKYYENNFFTPRQMLYCLKLLYENPDRFPTIVETMQKAEPHKYFKMREQRFDIAHKYGFLLTEYHQYINDCGIAFTDDPILLVAFTDNVTKAYEVLADYCTLMCDYAQYHTAERLEAEEAAERARAQAEAEARAEAEAKAEEEARAAETARHPISSLLTETEPTAPAEAPQEAPAPRRIATPSPFLVGILVVVLTLIALALLLRWRRRYELPLPWAIVAAALVSLALLLCALGAGRGPLAVKTRGEPAETVTAFFRALAQRDYAAANAQLSGYSSLGLEKEPQDAPAQLLYRALQESYACSLIGESTRDGFTARQQAQLRTLDLAAMQTDLEQEALTVVANLARTRERDEVYDAEGAYLPELTQEAYLRALENLLQHREDYYTTVGLQLTLRYEGGQWRLVPDQALLKALAGGLGY